MIDSDWYDESLRDQSLRAAFEELTKQGYLPTSHVDRRAVAAVVLDAVTPFVRTDEFQKFRVYLDRCEKAAAYNLSRAGDEPGSSAYWQMYWDLVKMLRDGLED